MFNLKHYRLYSFSEPNPTLVRLFEVFERTLNKGMTYREFRFFFFRHKPHFMDITFMEREGRDVGVIVTTFYRHELGGRPVTICRGAAGIDEDQPKGSLPSWLLCRKYIRYRLLHPFEKMYITGYMASPLLYSMICKYTHLAYPKAGVPVTAAILTLWDQLIRLYGMQKRVVAPFVVELPFRVTSRPQDQQRIAESQDRDVLFYLKTNPDYKDQKGVLTIVPVTWYNITVTSFRALVWKPITRKLRLSRKSRRRGAAAPARVSGAHQRVSGPPLHS